MYFSLLTDSIWQKFLIIIQKKKEKRKAQTGFVLPLWTSLEKCCSLLSNFWSAQSQHKESSWAPFLVSIQPRPSGDKSAKQTWGRGRIPKQIRGWDHKASFSVLIARMLRDWIFYGLHFYDNKKLSDCVAQKLKMRWNCKSHDCLRLKCFTILQIPALTGWMKAKCNNV